MKKIYIKLTASILSILIACTMIAGVSYAWLTLSANPEVQNISMTIGGGKTILLAPDLTKEDGEGNLIHYPGKFSAEFDFSQYETYAYLEELGGLQPVSTADGRYFMIPAYEEETGMLKEISDFTVDSTLAYANEEKGSYAYVDFWVVSPGTEKTLRVSMDTKKEEGSYVIERGETEEKETDRLQSVQTPGIAGSIARVGFLVNTDSAGEEAKASYQETAEWNSLYTELLGVYPEKGQETDLEKIYQFTIYEPNGTSHPFLEGEEGNYLFTSPLEYSPYGKSIRETEVKDHLMIQTASTYRNYVTSGRFLKSTAKVYAMAQDGKVSSEALSGELSGAVDDRMITILSPNVPQRIRMYFWLEGQDPDCINTTSVEASSLFVNIEFSGADQ